MLFVCIWIQGWSLKLDNQMVVLISREDNLFQSQPSLIVYSFCLECLLVNFIRSKMQRTSDHGVSNHDWYIYKTTLAPMSQRTLRKKGRKTLWEKEKKICCENMFPRKGRVTSSTIPDHQFAIRCCYFWTVRISPSTWKLPETPGYRS